MDGRRFRRRYRSWQSAGCKTARSSPRPVAGGERNPGRAASKCADIVAYSLLNAVGKSLQWEKVREIVEWVAMPSTSDLWERVSRKAKPYCIIITRTPFRISFFGGGTDYPVWFREFGGAVLSTAIDKSCYITCRRLPPFFEYHSRVSYSKVENVSDNGAISNIRRFAAACNIWALKMESKFITSRTCLRVLAWVPVRLLRSDFC